MGKNKFWVVGIILAIIGLSCSIEPKIEDEVIESGVETRATSSGVIFSNDVSGMTTGIVDDKDIMVSWLARYANGPDEGRVKVVSGTAAKTNKALKVTYPAGKHGSKDSGLSFQTNLNGNYDELYMAYWIKFDSGFDFNLGGKIPGLGGMPAPFPENEDNNFDIRLMWREEGKVEFYVHGFKIRNLNDDVPERIWWDNGGQRKFQAGKWHHIEIHVKLNTPGQRNGVLEGWFDGELAFRDTNSNVGIRGTGETDRKLNYMFFSSFYGGKWSPSSDQYITFDDFVVSKSRIGTSGNDGGGTDPEPEPTYISIPAKIQAENYSDMSGIQTQTTTDTGGGKNVSGINSGDWMDYNINVPSTGEYTIKYRVASNTNRIKFSTLKGSNTLMSFDSPATGGSQNWKTIKKNTTLNAGKQTLRIKANSSSWNINWLEFVKVTTDDGGSDTGSTTPSDLSIQYDCASTSSSTSQIKPDILLVNGGNSSVSLSNLKVRYWFTKDGRTASYSERYATFGNENMNGSFGSKNGVDYLELSFTSGAGSIAANDDEKVKVTINGNGNFNQSNDYSFNGSITTFQEYNKITLYQNGTLVWGVEP